MRLTGHKLFFADLYSKTDANKRIELRLNHHSGDIEYLDVLLPELIKQLNYLKFKIIGHEDCIMTTAWRFPITIK